MTLIVLFNTGNAVLTKFNCLVILLIYTFTDNQDTMDTIDEIDNILVYIYLGEVVIKILGLGITSYFSGNWNM